MDRKDLLSSNGLLFKSQAKMIEKACKETTKILVVGNPCNTNALAILNNSSIKPENITALSRLDENRAIALIANKLDVLASSVKNIGIYGNHSKTMVVDISEAFYTKNLTKKSSFESIKEGK
jgi:malate/lactate dehydrogenase